ncbi:fimbrial usher protein StbD [Pantoea stewartii]|uniref:fimbrial usher protein StbD n=1 Tax=Pantoea stewartii TaxID=66269 RepID=UPI0021E81A6B|nr:fimbrial usher protein StbD [Pantoea stewartii]UYK98989.1 fimbrial usher protein StbD [Pantoea stewartii]
MFTRILLLLITTLLVPLPLLANCTKVTSQGQLSQAAKDAGYTAKGWEGACDECTGRLALPAIININSGKLFQPSGTLLASAVGHPLNNPMRDAFTPNQILYRCDMGDADKLFEMYSTNGDREEAGKYATSEVEGAYFDKFKNVAVRLTNLTTGEYYSRYWKARQLSASDWYTDGQKIYIPASIFSSVLYEIFKIDEGKHYVNSDNYYFETNNQPRGYIAFKGPGLESNNLYPGADHSTVWNGWHYDWPVGWSSWKTVTYVRGAACEVYDYPAVVSLPLTSVGVLAAGGNSQAPFSITLRCETGATSGIKNSTVTSANVAMGFLVNQPRAVAMAQTLGLTTSSGGLTWLLDTNYGDNNGGSASGVGIKIYNSAGAALNLLPDISSTGTGNTRGWYAYKDLTTLTSSDTGEIYSGDFTASLEAIPGQVITSGTVNAQLQVVVSFQ